MVAARRLGMPQGRGGCDGRYDGDRDQFHQRRFLTIALKPRRPSRWPTTPRTAGNGLGWEAAVTGAQLFGFKLTTTRPAGPPLPG